ncbi:RNA polymerase sigma factor [Sorangium sp. So ce363]|uniref:RNA polymerase sigma factor n=1 Tax=Sorangium sp. So ce363 TaxID=3133304 RepID=UPI003F5DB3C6
MAPSSPLPAQPRTIAEDARRGSPGAAPPSPEAALIARAVAGEPAAVRALVDLLTPTIQERVMRPLLRRRRAAGHRDVRQEVEDLTQSVFLSLFADGGRTLRQWDAGRGLPLTSFVGLVAEREACSILRSRRRNPWTEQPTEDDALERADGASVSPEPAAISRELLAAIARKLRDRLSERGMELFYLLLVDERSTEEACAITGMTADAVYAWRSRIARLVRQIAAELAAEAEPRGRGASPSAASPGGGR